MDDTGRNAVIADLRNRIAALPRVRLAHLPTPLEEARQLTKHLGGPRIFVKRDDLTGIAFGGNKTRNLEFRLARALADDADTVIVGLDLQSNSARQTVGACNKLGLPCILVLEGARPNTVQGNLLVDYLLGAEIHFAPDAAAQRATIDARAAELRAAGHRPHVLNDNPMFDMASAAAYMECLFEILEQLAPIQPAALYMSSSGKGAAGLVLARKLLGLDAPIHCATATSEFATAPRTADIANRTADLLGLPTRVTAEEVSNFENFVGARYGIPSDAGNAAVRLFARTEALLLDPVYTGKAAAAMLAHIGENHFTPDDTVVFIHTGGTPALFTYPDLWVPQTNHRGR